MINLSPVRNTSITSVTIDELVARRADKNEDVPKKDKQNCLVLTTGDVGTQSAELSQIVTTTRLPNVLAQLVSEYASNHAPFFGKLVEWVVRDNSRTRQALVEQGNLVLFSPKSNKSFEFRCLGDQFEKVGGAPQIVPEDEDYINYFVFTDPNNYTHTSSWVIMKETISRKVAVIFEKTEQNKKSQVFTTTIITRKYLVSYEGDPVTLVQAKDHSW